MQQCQHQQEPHKSPQRKDSELQQPEQQDPAPAKLLAQRAPVEARQNPQHIPLLPPSGDVSVALPGLQLQ